MLWKKAVPVTVAIIVAAGCGTRDEDTNLDDVPPAEPAPGAPTAIDVLDMSVASGDFETVGDTESELEGTVELQRRGATQQQGVQLYTRISGLSEGAHAWHIHEGTCENRGAAIIPLSDLPEQDDQTGDLEPGADGAVERTVILNEQQTAQLTPGESFSVNIHTGASGNPGPPIACATLEIPDQLWGGADAELDTVPASY